MHGVLATEQKAQSHVGGLAYLTITLFANREPMAVNNMAEQINPPRLLIYSITLAMYTVCSARHSGTIYPCLCSQPN